MRTYASIKEQYMQAYESYRETDIGRVINA